jgi:hypothetical protein
MYKCMQYIPKEVVKKILLEIYREEVESCKNFCKCFSKGIYHKRFASHV